jgi:recombination protein RecA
MVIFINQIRMKIGVMFGSPETTTGGNALKFYASVRCDIRRIGAIKQGDQVVGNRTRVRVVKNKTAPPFREAEFDIMYGMGINKAGEIIDLGVEIGVVDKSGSWYSYGEERLGQGRDNACDFLRENPKMMAEIEQKVRQDLGLVPATANLSVVDGGAKDAQASEAKAEAPAKAAVAAAAAAEKGKGAKKARAAK